jgi:hypothetical protein
MTSRADALALRKQALVARAASQRRHVRQHAAHLRQGLRFPQAASAILASPQGRKIAITLALMLFKRGRLGRMLRFGLGAVAIARLAGAAHATWARSSPQDGELRQDPADSPGSP